MNSSELMLKPCPFCGKPVSMIEIQMVNESGNFHTVYLGVKCNSCGAETKIDTMFNREDAFDIWNMRAESDSRVLCKDCRFNELPCKANVLCEKGMLITNPYGYCSEGERRTDEQ